MTAQRESDQVATTCPACSPDTETVHTILNVGGQATVRCHDCEHVHKTQLPDPGTTTLTVIISQDGESLATTIERTTTTELAVGDDFIVETDQGVFAVETTALELPDDTRPERATASAVETVWTRSVGNVTVPVTVHPRPGTGHRQDSYSTTLQVPGTYTITVGETETVDETTVEIEGIHLRKDAADDGPRKLDTEAASAEARDIDRVYARDQETARSPW